MKMYHPDKHEQIVRMGTKNSEQKGVAKTVAFEVEKAEGRSRIVRMHECSNGGGIFLFLVFYEKSDLLTNSQTTLFLTPP